MNPLLGSTLAGVLGSITLFVLNVVAENLQKRWREERQTPPPAKPVILVREAKERVKTMAFPFNVRRRK